MERRQMPGEQVADPALVLPVDIGVQEADGDRFHAGLAQLPRDPGDFLRIDRPRHPPVGQHPLIHPEAPLARHQGGGVFDLRVEHVVAVLVADMEHVAEPGGDQQPRRRT